MWDLIQCAKALIFQERSFLWTNLLRLPFCQRWHHSFRNATRGDLALSEHSKLVSFPSPHKTRDLCRYFTRQFAQTIANERSKKKISFPVPLFLCVPVTNHQHCCSLWEIKMPKQFWKKHGNQREKSQKDNTAQMTTLFRITVLGHILFAFRRCPGNKNDRCFHFVWLKKGSTLVTFFCQCTSVRKKEASQDLFPLFSKKGSFAFCNMLSFSEIVHSNTAQQRALVRFFSLVEVLVFWQKPRSLEQKHIFCLMLSPPKNRQWWSSYANRLECENLALFLGKWKRPLSARVKKISVTFPKQTVHQKDQDHAKRSRLNPKNLLARPVLILYF